MALVDVPSIVQWPYWPPNYYNVNNAGTFTTIDAAADYVAFIFWAPKTGSIEQVHFLTQTVTSAQNMHISIQDVDANFKPDGTADQYTVLASGSISSDSRIASGPLTNDGTGGGTRRSVTKGDRLAVVMRFDSTAGDVDIVSGHVGTGGMGIVPNTLFSTNSGSTWSFQDRLPNLAIEYVTDGLVYTPYMFPFDSSTQVTTLNTSSSPDEVAMKFQVPFTGRCIGAHMLGAIGDNQQYSIEDVSKSIVAGPTKAQDDVSSAQQRYVEWATPVTLSIDTDYYLIHEPTTTTSKSYRYYTLNTAGFRVCMPHGVLSSFNERTDNGAWTETTTQYMPFALVFDQLDNGAGGGGGSCNLVNGTAVIPATCPV